MMVNMFAERASYLGVEVGDWMSGDATMGEGEEDWDMDDWDKEWEDDKEDWDTEWDDDMDDWD